MQNQSSESSENLKIVLIGYMGSGKSTIGKALANKLNLPFIDLDLEIEKAENKTIAYIFSEKGEIYFRKLENKILKKVLSEPRKVVLATGGGTPCYADSLQHILQNENTSLIYLKVSLQHLTTRLFTDKNNRPMLSHLNLEEDVEDFIRKHLFERSYYYSQAPLVVMNENKSTENVVEEITERLF